MCVSMLIKEEEECRLCVLMPRSGVGDFGFQYLLINYLHGSQLIPSSLLIALQ